MSQYICTLTVLSMDRSVFKSFSLYYVPAGHFFELMKQIMVGFLFWFNTAFKGLSKED